MIYLFFGLVAAGLWLVFHNMISFAMFMLLLLLLTGVIWLVDRFLFEKKRTAGVAEPLVVEYAKSFFPVILLVFIIRSFVVEPFKIPSGSMMPTLLIGDFILVNKFTYGLRVPILNHTFIDIGHPKHGDVMVFHYPVDPSKDFIKRVVGLPGDIVEYRNKQLTINHQPVHAEFSGHYEYAKAGLNFVEAETELEQLGEHRHTRLIVPNTPTLNLGQVEQFPLVENCKYDQEGFTCKVPAGHYFMMGDNRDDSNDSRYWGFVPEQNIVGKAFLVWLNLGQLSRIGTSIP